MKKINIQEVQTDNEGYLKDITSWNESLALYIAKKEGITMTPEVWEIIYFIRSFYFEFNTSPGTRMLVKALFYKFGKKKGNSRYLFRLLPKGPAKQATKIAGLPKPVKCL